MDAIKLNMPFVPLSTKINCAGEIERRFLTPFGLIDLIFRTIPDGEDEKQRLEIELGGDAECWSYGKSGPVEFRKALLCFVRGMINKDPMSGEIPLDLSAASIRVKGPRVHITGQFGNGVPV